MSTSSRAASRTRCSSSLVSPIPPPVPLRARAIRRWIQLLGRAERLMSQASPDDADVQRRASTGLDALAAYEHELTPAERRHAREMVWRRDHTDPLPAEKVRREWARCRCRACAIAAELGRPSLQPETQRRLRLASPASRATSGEHIPDGASEHAPDGARIASTAYTTGTLVPASWGGTPDQHLVTAATVATATVPAAEGDPR